MDIIFPLIASLAAVGTPALDRETIKEEYRSITIATTSLPSCQQIGYTVDRDGLIEWSEAARARAVAAGASVEEAREKLFNDVRFEHNRLIDRFSTLIIGRNNAFTPLDFSKRARGYWKRRCEELARNEPTAGYFSEN